MSNHKEIDCPVCPGPVCVKDGAGPEMVFVLIYTHKHGVDITAHRTRDGAVANAYGLACERVEEDRWEDEEARAKFEAFDDLDEALAYFHEQEIDWNYPESLEITETKLWE